VASIRENLMAVRERMAAACRRAGRDPSTVQLMGVTKTVPVERIREALEAGLRLLGENYVQEARQKVELLNERGVTWHFIGHLQTNKCRQAVETFQCIQSVDRENLAVELDRRSRSVGRRMPVLLQVNVGDETSKAGVSLKNLETLFDVACRLEGIEVRGLMALPPYSENPEAVRPHFRAVRQALEALRLKAAHPERLTELSMGMSHDFEVAIEEGATLVRVGTAIFGERAKRA